MTAADTPPAPTVERPPAASHPTYGQFMDAARWHANTAQGHLSWLPFATTRQARDTLAARDELLTALGMSARAVIGPVRYAALTGHRLGRREVDTIDPTVRALLTWISQLDKSHHSAHPGSEVITSYPVRHEQDLGRTAAAFVAARIAVAAATDLVLTHIRPTGAARADVDPVLAGADWGPLLIDVARIVALVARTEPLALRCRQVGVSRADIDRHLPVRDTLVDDTWALATAWGFPDPALRELTVVHPPVRTGDPAAEWTDRMRHLYIRMLAHRDAGHVSVRTLQDLARLGTVVSHVLATSGHNAQAQSEVTAQWQTMSERLEPLRSTEPGDRQVRSTVERLLTLASPATTAGAPAVRARLLRAIDYSTSVLDQCAVIADRLMSTSTDVWMPPKPFPRYLRPVHVWTTRAQRLAPVPQPWPQSGMARTGSTRAASSPSYLT